MRARIADARDLIRDALGQQVEAGRRYRREQLALLGKMLVGGVVAYPGAARELAQGKIHALGFAQDFERRGDDGTAQIAVMIGTQVGFLVFAHDYPKMMPLRGVMA